ncbi:hypothetical protein QWY85_06745 [Neolewinella lacunae]|uniref:Uncharacterized protein n=1 Tax=Neolewinella lacunae TaxID=1517758 RepID=A0A923TBH7_9BACT|nr:hypothetical protein [Neolewinella lacunae]MBC6992607.1 hypothetical protein [Neolewinella lacunae]MDN3634348.1 hypothetical protein [Neolewinella lacunae]
MAKRIPLSEEMKKAVSRLSPREKDKLLFRLLVKEPALVAKLEFELLDAGETAEDRRLDLLKEIEGYLQAEADHFYSPGYLLLAMRSISGDITRHVKTTKDKYGEIQANLLLLNDGLRPNRQKIASFSAGKARTLNDYVVKRTSKIVSLLHKQHPDIHLDFQDDLRELGENIVAIPLMANLAKVAGIDLAALLRGEVPA